MTRKMVFVTATFGEFWVSPHQHHLSASLSLLRCCLLSFFCSTKSQSTSQKVQGILVMERNNRHFWRAPQYGNFSCRMGEQARFVQNFAQASALLLFHQSGFVIEQTLSLLTLGFRCNLQRSVFLCPSVKVLSIVQFRISLLMFASRKQNVQWEEQSDRVREWVQRFWMAGELKNGNPQLSLLHASPRGQKLLDKYHNLARKTRSFLTFHNSILEFDVCAAQRERGRIGDVTFVTELLNRMMREVKRRSWRCTRGKAQI